MKRAAFNVNAEKRTAEVYVYDEIGEAWGSGISAKMFVDDLAALGQIDELTVRINSPGGDVFDGLAMFNALVRHPARVVTAVDGMAASIAATLAMAGDSVEMAENALMMIHEPWTIAIGNADDFRSMISMLEKSQDNIVDSFLRHSTVGKAQIEEWMKDETWFTADEAVKAGLATVVTGEKKLAALALDLRRYKHPPECLAEHGQMKLKFPPPAQWRLAAAKRALTLSGG